MGWLPSSAHIQFHRQVDFFNVQLIVEIGDLFGFRLEVLIPLVGEDEIECQKPSPDRFEPMPAPVAKVLVAKLGVQLAGVQMVDAPIAPVFAHRGPFTAAAGWMLWLVLGSSFLISIFWPVITPITCGSYMQPFWLSSTLVAGTFHCLSGSPDFTHTNVFFKVPFALTITSCDFTGWPL